jgi:hypothetical protein
MGKSNKTLIFIIRKEKCISDRTCLERVFENEHVNIIVLKLDP